MNSERDPLLETAFDAADATLDDDNFTRAVVGQVQKRRRRVVIGRLAALTLLVLLEILLESPLQASLGIVAEVLGRSLVNIENEWLAFALAPINSIAGLLGMTLLGLNALYRRLLY